MGHSYRARTENMEAIEIPAHMIHQNVPTWIPTFANQAKLIIVDMPGFDDTCASESEVLKPTANWLANL